MNMITRENARQFMLSLPQNSFTAATGDAMRRFPVSVEAVDDQRTIQLKGKSVGGAYFSRPKTLACDIYIREHDESFMVQTLYHEIGHIEFADPFCHRVNEAWSKEQEQAFELNSEIFAMFYAIRQTLDLKLWRSLCVAVLLPFQGAEGENGDLTQKASAKVMDTWLWLHAREVLEAIRKSML